MTSKQAQADSQDLRAKHVEAIAASGDAVSLPLQLPVDRTRFLENYYEQADIEDLARDPHMLAAAALTHLAWAGTRKAGTAKLRVFNPTLDKDGWTSEHTIVQTANDDMPFLVDSLTMTLNAMGHGAHITIHPLLQVARGAKGELLALPDTDAGQPAPAHGARAPTVKTESFIHIEIVRETDPQILATIERTLASTLRDVRVAVED